MFKRTLISFFVFSVLFLSSCGNHTFEDFLKCSDVECIFEEIISRTGWLAEDENLDSIPQDIVIYDDSTGNLPKDINLEKKFPPIGDQGKYGTCVAWATGYNLKTSLNAIEKGWSEADLKKTENQTSPKDLWFVIGKSDKGTNCEGTNFEPALDALISKGAGNLNSVPYSNMGNCSGTSAGNASNKLANYRKIAYNNSLSGGNSVKKEGMTLDNFKGYLSQGRPILLGAKLGDRFMSWNSNSVISTDTYNNSGMQHAYHAMILVGYDDSKNAFRVRNSWGTDWGDKGSIWVGYDFFLENFCFAAFVAQNPSPNVSSGISENQLLSGYDLLAADAEDFANPRKNSPRERVFSYNVYNSGKEPILASQRWTVLYMYYNAFNANEFGIIYEDYYTDERGELGDFGNYTKTSAWNNFNVQPGKKVGEEEFPEGFTIEYTMPPITGKYYLVVYADAYNAIEESNEDNNFYFITADNGKPLDFINGIMQNESMAAKKFLAKESKQAVPSANAKSVQELGGNPNAYTPAEIRSLVLRNKKK